MEREIFITETARGYRAAEREREREDVETLRMGSAN